MIYEGPLSVTSQDREPIIGPRKKSTFEGLPLEIRRSIYGYLLKAKGVRLPSTSHHYYCLHRYNFAVAVLRASKQICNEAYDMLYHENHFTTVTCYWEKVQ